MDRLAVARMFEYTSRDTPWNRQLWRLGAVLEIRELLECWQASSDGTLAETAVKNFSSTVIKRISRDPGFGDDRTRGNLKQFVNRSLVPGSYDSTALEDVLSAASDAYLTNWANAIEASPPGLSIDEESASRAVVGHLLGSGFSAEFIHGWLTRSQRMGDVVNLHDLLHQAAQIETRPTVLHDMLLLVVNGSQVPEEAPDNGWLSPTEASAWLTAWFPNLEPRPPRHRGGLRLTIAARDVSSALSEAESHVARIEARIRLGTKSRIEFHPEFYVVGQQGPVSRSRVPRPVHVRAVHRNDMIFRRDLPGDLDAAMELLEPMRQGNPPAAVIGAWAALEALFLGPGDGRRDGPGRVVVAARMARIVACSYVRAELTSLANAYMSQKEDDLAGELREFEENVQRARRFEQAVRGGEIAPDPFSRDRHNASHRRMGSLIARPSETLLRVTGQLEDAFRRLYRQRNLIAHSGAVRSVALLQTLRTVAPLVGAGVDRAVFASTGGRTPLELAARAEVRLAMVGRTEELLVDLLS